ncbi:ACT domain-containing protein [Maritalea sp.]|uniref:ACT domain-containing protein n=1 Tax=Maritalea sp. TaxID=2003361 RepID=UPI003EFA9997
MSNSAIHDLSSLIKGMSPQLSPRRYAFATIAQDKFAGIDLTPIMSFVEDEGITLILLEKDAIAANIEHEFVCQKITLYVHSALEAVGFMAAISDRLTQVGVPCNVVAGYHHDHLFIPVEKVDVAMNCLAELSKTGA